MKITSVEAFPVSLPLKKPFTIALGTMTHSPHVVVKLTTDGGIIGYGEASTWHVVYGYDQHELAWVIDRYLGPAVKGMDVADLEFIHARMDAVLPKNLMAKAGITIASGADSGTPFNLHGENLKELELLVGIGLSPMEAIVSATRIAAETLGLGSRVGSIESGKLADLIVVEGDPLKDITVLQQKEKMVAVMKDGQFYKRSL